VRDAATSLSAVEETERDDPDGESPVLSSLAELRELDPRSVLWIVGGAAAAEDAADRDKRVMAHLDVPASVPEPVRKSFDRIRAIFRQGLFCYDLYTVAGDQARLLIELALKERFIELYGGTVLFTDGRARRKPCRPPLSAMSTGESAALTGGSGTGRSSCAAGARGFSSPEGWPVSCAGRGQGCSPGRVTGCAT
jgi:hypothetical protein